MLVRAKISGKFANTAFKAGDVIDLPEAIAKQWLSAGWVEPATPANKEKKGRRGQAKNKGNRAK